MTKNGTSPVRYDGERPDDKYKTMIFNLILQKGPISFDRIVDEINYSQNKVKMDLLGLHREGFIVQNNVEREYYKSVNMTDGKWCVAVSENDT